jgi:hypothetical protein
MRIEMRFNLAFLLYGASALMSFPAIGQSSAATPNPTDVNARAPAIKYESAFAGYAPYREEKPAPWRDVNDEVARVGGHIGIFRGAGGAGHGAGAPGPIKPALGEPAGSSIRQPAGQPPPRSAPQAPRDGRPGH